MSSAIDQLSLRRALGAKFYMLTIWVSIEPLSLLWVICGLKRTSSLLRLLKVKRTESQKADADRIAREIRIVGDT